MSSVKLPPVESWPSVRGVCKQLDISQPYVHRLLVAGRLRGVRTSLGWLLNPESVTQFVESQSSRKRAR